MPKISALPTGTEPDGTEFVAAVQGTVTVKLSVSQLGPSEIKTYGTLADATAATIAATVDIVETLGHTAAGDNGGARYSRIATTTAAAWRFTSADGQMWSLINRPGISPEVFGIFEGADCTAACNDMESWLNLVGGGLGGAVIDFKPGAEYEIWPAATTPAILFQLTACNGITFNFNGAKFTTDNLFVPQGSPYVFSLSGCSNITFNNPWYVQSAFTTLSLTKGAYFLYLGSATFSNNIIVNNGTMTGGISYFTAAVGSTGVGASRSVVLNNAKINSTYYGINVSASADGLTATGIECTNVARAYFAYNVSNHTVEVIGNGGDAHDWCLLKCYAYPGKPDSRNVLSNIDLTIRCRGQNAATGVGSMRSLVALAMQQTSAPLTISAVADNGSGFARITVNSAAGLDAGERTLYFADLGGWTTINGTKQVATKIDATTIDLLDVAYPGGYTSGGTVSYTGEIRNIKIKYDVEDGTGFGPPLAFNTQKHAYDSSTDTTPRGYTVENVEMSGSLKGYDNSIVVGDLFSDTSGTGLPYASIGDWTSETIRNIHLHDLIVEGTDGAININATDMSPFLTIEDVYSPSGIVWTITDPSKVLRPKNVSANGITDHRAVVQSVAVSNQFVTGIDTDGALTRAQPSFTNISGVATAPQGGTGQSSYAVGDILYASTTTALSKLADVATGNALISGGVGVAPAWGKIGISTHVSGLGTGIATALAVNTESAGAPVLFNGAGGTPSSLTGTNITGTAAGLTAGSATSATNAVNSGITNDTSTNANVYPTWVTASTGDLPLKVTNTKLVYNPALGSVGIGTSVAPTDGILAVYGGSTTLTGTQQFAMNFQPTFSTAATNTGNGFYIRPATVADTFTMAAMRGIYIDNAIKGAGSTITAQYQLVIGNPTQGATNYSIYSIGGRNYFGGGLALGADSDPGAGHLTQTGGHQIYSATAVPAGGTAGVGFKMSSTANLGIFFGSGAPSLSAAQGSLYLRIDGSSTSTRLYINTNGTTGWTNVTTAT